MTINKRVIEILFIEASKNGDYDEVWQYLKDGVDVDAENELGITAIMNAVCNRHKKIVNLLISYGASFYIEDRKFIKKTRDSDKGLYDLDANTEGFLIDNKERENLINFLCEIQEIQQENK